MSVLLKHYCFIFEDRLSRQTFKSYVAVWTISHSLRRTSSIPDPHLLNAKNIPKLLWQRKIHLFISKITFVREHPCLQIILQQSYSKKHVMVGNNMKKSVSKTETLLPIILKIITCQFYPLPNNRASAYLSWYCVLSLTYRDLFTTLQHMYILFMLSFF